MVFFKALNGFLMPPALQRTVFSAIFLFSFLHSAKLTHCTGHGNIFHCIVISQQKPGLQTCTEGLVGQELIWWCRRFQDKLQAPSAGKGCCCSEGCLMRGCCRGTEGLAQPQIQVGLGGKFTPFHGQKASSCPTQGVPNQRFQPGECPSFPLVGIGGREIPPGMLQR